jgi:hypothetical protein
MSDNYTFRYLNADGSLNGMTMMLCKDRESAHRDAAQLMPNNAAALEIWQGDTLVRKPGAPEPEHSDRKQDFLGPETPIAPDGAPNAAGHVDKKG